MSKYLLLFGLACVFWWLWRKSRGLSRDHSESSTVERDAESMVQCARCGVNQPISESILANGNYYCCAAHLRAARSDDA
ncbi:PP0621 family protein [Candidatus Accumulibacter sp. ACC003]|uniref:PP0621 family protein n=1 Tax=Candidatus Accumulibacter sp. ACC003 TaxID=2823334 RepID=UPI0025BC3CD2|nr:PP0621 family protein [Candidatus Accumulibacter sp. ACC003]